MLDNLSLSPLTARLREELPVAAESLELREAGTGLVLVDLVDGFATVGAGNLAPRDENAQVSAMVDESDRLARGFCARRWPVLAFLDTHEPGKPEPPYPPHCEKGTGEEELVPALKWMEVDDHVTLMPKDCINGFVGAMGPDGANVVVDWVEAHGLKHLLVVGICTDVCVMDFVLTLLSARNHGLMPTLKDIVVYEPGCATYDMSRPAAACLGLPETAAHPQALTHHLGLYFMASRGAVIAGGLADR